VRAQIARFHHMTDASPVLYMSRLAKLAPESCYIGGELLCLSERLQAVRTLVDPRKVVQLMTDVPCIYNVPHERERWASWTSPLPHKRHATS
jgi:hypothetical protein